MTGDWPRDLNHVLETVLYCRSHDWNAVVHFYDEILGFRNRRFSPGGYRLGPSVLLIFNADRSAIQKSPPAHGAPGAAHTCFLAPPGSYELWKTWIRGRGVEIIDEIEWMDPLVGRSFYFHDPAGNVLEIADRDIWP